MENSIKRSKSATSKGLRFIRLPRKCKKTAKKGRKRHLYSTLSYNKRERFLKNIHRKWSKNRKKPFISFSVIKRCKYLLFRENRNK